MQEAKIIQIMPAPRGLYAEFEGNAGEPNYKCPIIALQLMENCRDKDRFVEPMVFDPESCIESDPESAMNFLRYGYTLNDELNPNLP